MAILLRGGQWRLDEAAFRVGAGEFSYSECEVLAEALRELAAMLDCYGDRLPPEAIDSECREARREHVPQAVLARRGIPGA